MAFPKEEIGRRLEQALAGKSLREVGDAAGVSHTAVRKWYRGEYLPESERLVRLCQEFGLSLDEILGTGQPGRVAEPQAARYGARFSFPDYPEEDYTLVPFLEDDIAAGPGAEIDGEAIRTHHAVRSEWLLGLPGRPVRVRVSPDHRIGESMLNTIAPGAVVTLAWGPQSDITPWKVYAVYQPDMGYSIKRVVPIPSEQGIYCVSDNRVFQPFMLRESEGGRVVGKVIRWEQGES